MKNNVKIISFVLLASILFSGCSFSNPFGIGQEKSACEVSAGFGVCGEPKKIYLHRDKIKQLQNDYMKSGYDEELFFAINETGDMLVKSERDDNWQRYDGSKIQKEINKRLSKQKSEEKKLDETKRISGNISLGQDIPVTMGNDLSLIYQNQKPLIETRTNVGEIIRDNGLIQKIWIAPVVDSKKDLISAHEIYLVVKEPRWVVGEETPKQIKSSNIGLIPTPISKDLLTKTQSLNEHEEKVVSHFNNNNKGGLLEEIANDPKANFLENKEDLNLINNFIQE